MATTEVSRLATSSTDKTYSYAAIETFDGTTIDDSDILEVYDNGTLLTLTTHYTVDEVNEDIILNGGYTISSGDRIVIRRSTDIDNPYVDFVNNVSIDEADLDLAVQQNRFLIQEINTDIDNALKYDIVNDCWDAESRKICNLANAVSSTDAVNLGQVNALISGGDAMDVGEGLYDEANGDASTTIFEPTDFPTTDINAAKVFVSIDGVIQRPSTDYTYTLVSGTPTVTFTTAPPTGTGNVQFRVLPGVVTTTYDAETIDGDTIIENTLNGNRLEDGTVDGDALVNSSVDLNKLDGGTGVVDRVAVFNASGVATARQLVLGDIDLSSGGSGVPETFTTTSVTTGGSAPPQALGTWTWTNSTGSSVFVVLYTKTQNGSGTILLDGTLISSVGNSGSGLSYQTVSFFVPDTGVITTTGAGTTKNVEGFTYQEV